jgi:hypothetical protein
VLIVAVPYGGMPDLGKSSQLPRSRVCGVVCARCDYAIVVASVIASLATAKIGGLTIDYSSSLYDGSPLGVGPGSLVTSGVQASSAVLYASSALHTISYSASASRCRPRVTIGIARFPSTPDAV